MRHARHARHARSARLPILLTVLAAALAAGTAACGSSGSSGSSADPLAGLTSKQIAQRAAAGTMAAARVRIAGSGSSSGQPIAVDLTLIRGKGCEGSISEGGLGSYRMVYTGDTVWVMPDTKMSQSLSVPAATQAIIKGKYVQMKAGGNGLGGASQVCSLSGLLNTFAPDAGTAKGVLTTINGQSAVKITDKTGTGYAYVTNTATPELLQIDRPGSNGGTLNFSYSGLPQTITPPPASQVVDGSRLGF